jgi:hypothetical protein
MKPEVIQYPVDFMESLAALHFPAKTDALLQSLMDRNTNGQLTPEQRDELEALAELSESLSLIRAQSLQLLGRKPS